MNPRLPLGRACAIVEPLLEELRDGAASLRIQPTGGMRRFEPTVRQLSLVCAASADEVLPILARLPSVLPSVAGMLHQSAHKAILLVQDHPVTVHFVDPANYGMALLLGTGSLTHVQQLRARARTLGFALLPAGLLGPGQSSPRPCLTEKEIYAALGLPFIAPELRLGGDEIDAALAGQLPALVTETDIRGDLHMHSDWSDGRDTMQAMIEAARDLGYEYVAITDHSQSAGASRVLTPGRLRAQGDRLEKLRRRLPGVTVLHGAEVDILPDGRLDFPDEVLEPLDLVLASLHERAGQDGEQLTERYVRAMQHPLVHVITHPANRIVGYRAGYDLNWDRLFTVAAETGTILEIDGAPVHLDLDGALARRAVAAGALIGIHSDCHRAAALGQQMRLGVATARRGWVEARHVVNTRPLGELRAILARKRAPS